MFEDADQFLKIAVGLGILAAGLGVSYHYAIYIPNRDLRQTEAAEQNRILKKDLAKDDYDACLSQASYDYMINWNGDCKINGVDKKSAGCTLPNYIASRWNKELKDSNSICTEIYKIELK